MITEVVRHLIILNMMTTGIAKKLRPGFEIQIIVKVKQKNISWIDLVNLFESNL